MEEHHEGVNGREEAEVQPVKKKHGPATALWIIFISLLVCAVGAVCCYIYGSNRYRSHFYPKTIINGIDVSGMTAEEAREVMRTNAEGYQLTIKEVNGEEILTAADLGWKADDKGRLDQIITGQNTGSWYRHVNEAHIYEAESLAVYDTQLADQAVMNLTCIKEGIRPTDAKLMKNDDGTYSVQPETEGTKLDEERATNAIFEALVTGSTEVDLTDLDCYRHPSVYSDDPVLNARADAWNRYMGVEIAVRFGDETEMITGDMLKPYVYDDGTTVELEDDWIDALVIEWAERYNTYGKEMSFYPSNGMKMTIPAGGSCGWYLNVEKTAEKIREMVFSGDAGEIDPVWIREGLVWGSSLSSSYLEISLSSQKLWIVSDRNVVYETDIISGKPGSDRATKTGACMIEEIRNDVSADPVETGGIPAVHACRIRLSSGQYIEDASWRSEFGNDIYEESGSHGAVLVSEEAMSVIAEAIQNGMTVVIY